MFYYRLLVMSVLIGDMEALSQYFMKMDNVDMKLDLSLGEYQDIPMISCLGICMSLTVCHFVSYHSGSNTCHTHVVDRTGIAGQGWVVYWKKSSDNDIMTGVTAFQHSTSYGGDAIKAVDGNFNTNIHDGSCTHTSNDDNGVYWVMQFGRSGVVKGVVLYLRSDWTLLNTLYDVMVAQTKSEAIARAGDFCGDYDGPLIVDHPFKLTISCNGPLFGRFLRVSRDSLNALTLCEVMVFGP